MIGDWVGLGRLDPDSYPSGRGMAHTRVRAREMGAKLRFEAAHPGACVSLLWLVAATAPQGGSVDGAPAGLGARPAPGPG